MVSKLTCFKNKAMPTLIDLAITNVLKSLKCVEVLEEGLSDCHHMVCFATTQHVDIMKPREIVYRSYKKFDKDKYMQDMENIPFQVCEKFDCVDDAYWLCSKLYVVIDVI